LTTSQKGDMCTRSQYGQGGHTHSHQNISKNDIMPCHGINGLRQLEKMVSQYNTKTNRDE